MPSFSGKFQYLNPEGAAFEGGPCRVSFATDLLTLTPATGAPLAFDLNDIDVFSPSDHALALTLYTGKKILLSQFGKTFQNLSHDLLEAYRNRMVQCLLLEDLEEIARFDGFAQLDEPDSAGRAFSSPAEFRLYKSNLVVLPTGGTGFQWRLADIDAVSFDETSYAVMLRSRNACLTLTKLAKRTREFKERLQDAIAQLTEKSAKTVRDIFPFLNPDQLQQVAQLMKEGHVAPLAKLKAIHPKTEPALVENVVDAKLRPYFETLLRHVPAGWLYAGFKLIRREEESAVAGPAEEAAESDRQPEETIAEDISASRDEEAVGVAPVAAQSHIAEEAEEGKAEPLLHWFFFPLASEPGTKQPSNLIAWEATSKSGRATYFFRLVPPEQSDQLQDAAKAPGLIEEAIAQLNDAIVVLNFRRKPIYLSDDSLEMQPRYRRYAIACRKLPELRRLRASFLGRALHTSPEAWEEQLEEFLAKAQII